MIMQHFNTSYQRNSKCYISHKAHLAVLHLDVAQLGVRHLDVAQLGVLTTNWLVVSHRLIAHAVEPVGLIIQAYAG